MAGHHPPDGQRPLDFPVPGEKAFLYEKGIGGERFKEVLKAAQKERASGVRVLVAQMNKNRKFQKEQLLKEGYEEFVEFYREALKQ